MPNRNVTPSTTDSSQHNRPENGTESLLDRLAEIRARLDAVLEGKFDTRPKFIAHAPADTAWLLDEVERYMEIVRANGDV